ncbi:hypothetical protein PPERSA_01430 [Pseudocohnilembus persalinus]|uniref:DNA/RNA-binding protein Alba-like domain-containing protein n=1 Tax=Pseudocohnilembus persalinus TaxID=266149 RepID=A0A0V0QH45_PSEPJ|nr:hypothetical protein PPERSA_01430 [Pseudocohnilembus persalinus]|eukprot:KRX01527.1 hypothetical protein PPERSA_01430 [Pseudocohnilembus persalinus]
MTITINSKTVFKLCIQECKKQLEAQNVVNLQAFDDQVGRLCLVVEQIKAQIDGLHQVNEISSNEDQIQMKVYLTKATPNQNHYGYQVPKDQESEEIKEKLKNNLTQLNENLLKSRNLEQKQKERNQKLLERKNEKIFDNELDQESQRKEVEEFKVTMKQKYGEILAILYEKLLFQKNPLDTIKLVAAGKAIPKACFLTEIVKNNVKGLYQINTIGETENTKIKYMDGKTMIKDVIFPLAEIYLTKIKPNTQHFGYQEPIDPSKVKQITEDQFREKYRKEIEKNQQQQQQDQQQQSNNNNENNKNNSVRQQVQWKTRGGARGGRGGGNVGARSGRQVQQQQQQQDETNYKNTNNNNINTGKQKNLNNINNNQNENRNTRRYGNTDDNKQIDHYSTQNNLNNNNQRSQFSHHKQEQAVNGTDYYYQKYQRGRGYGNENNDKKSFKYGQNQYYSNYQRGQGNRPYHNNNSHYNDYYNERYRRVNRYRRDENRRNYPNSNVRETRNYNNLDYNRKYRYSNKNQDQYTQLSQDGKSFYRPKISHSQEYNKYRNYNDRNQTTNYRHNNQNEKGEYNPNTQKYVRNSRNENENNQRKYFNYHLNENRSHQQQERKYGNV